MAKALPRSLALALILYNYSPRNTPGREPDVSHMRIERQSTETLPTILVVDDDCDVRAAVLDMLESAGYTAVCVANGDEALAHLRRNPPPSAILLDLFMPIMNGWEFVRRVRATRFGNIPIIAITGAEPHWGSPVPLLLRKPLSPDFLMSALSQAGSRQPQA